MELRVAEFGSEPQRASVELRRRILRTPLGLTFTQEELDEEFMDEHLIALEDNVVIGVAVATPVSGDTIKMRQVAVDPEHQGRGVGQALVRFFEERAAAKGYSRIVLHAREPAVRFYLHLDYEIEGEPFEEVTIPHWRMVKEIVRGQDSALQARPHP